MEDRDTQGHGWLVKGLEEASYRVKDLPEWAKENSSAIEKFYLILTEYHGKGPEKADQTALPTR